MESEDENSRDDNGLVEHQKKQEYKALKSVKEVVVKKVKNSHSAIRTLIAVCKNFPSTHEDSYLNPKIEDFLKTFELKDYGKFLIERNNAKKAQISEKSLDLAITFFARSRRISDVAKYIARHKELANDPERLSSFQDEAFCCTYVLSFYTGLNPRFEEKEVQIVRAEDSNLTNEEHYSIISSHLLKALNSLPCYWGSCIRTLELTSEDQDFYTEGSIISWNIFSSAKKGDKPGSMFEKRNTYFYIWSLTGREISKFSNYRDEDEILIPPWSTFIVVKKTKSFFGGRTYIYLREVALGPCEKPTLWVDDKIFLDTYDNQKMREDASLKGIGLIPKISTEQALNFLDSELGKWLKTCPGFKIITNMARKTDLKEDDEEACNYEGATLLRQLRERGFEQEVLIYVRNGSASRIAVKLFCVDKNKVNVAGKHKICTHRKEVRDYIMSE